MDRRLDVGRLESLLESAKLLGSSLHLDDLLRHTLRTVMGRLVVSRAVIAIRDQAGAMRVAIVRGIPALKAGAAFSAEIAQQHDLFFTGTIGNTDDAVGLLSVGRPARGDLDADEREFLQALLTLAGAAVANARAHGEVIRSNQELRSLIDLGRGIAAAIEPDEVANLLMLTLTGRWLLRRHALATWKQDQDPLLRVRGIDGLSVDALRERFATAAEPERGTDGLIYFPIRAASETVGVVVMGPRLDGQAYADADLEFCAGLVAQAAVALENAWRIKDTLYRQQLEKELSLAATIQQDLFPDAMPLLKSTLLAARNRQARAVGGDYYDALSFGDTGPEGARLLTVADISGKGIAASLLMANIQATLRALLVSESSLPQIAAKTSELLYASTPSSKYATAIMVRYDPSTGECEYVNGGHNEGILLRKSGDVELLDATGVPIGLLPKRTFASQQFQMNAGDTLLIYSDGVPDACTLDDVEFGLDRTIECLKTARDLGPEEILDHLFTSIDAFVGSAPQHDDITALVVKRVTASAPA